jgi:hypothetical protein
MHVEDYRDLVRPLVAGRKVIVTGGPLAALTPMVTLVRALGALRPFVLGFGEGTGELPDSDRADVLVLELSATDIVGELRAQDALLADLPPHARAALDRFDPERVAVVIVTTPSFAQPRVAGRPSLGPRTPESIALEDKTIVDQLWDAFGVTRPPATVVAAEARALDDAASRLDTGTGTVWSGDTSEGFNGGGLFVRWVKTGDVDTAREAASFFAAHCRRVRVMPFLAGTPCSIHGMVFRDGVSVFRPVELVTLARPGAGRMVYAGTATFYDPPPEARDEMRAAARRVGDGLRERIGFRGAFTVDGVITVDGFLPTELNPRSGAGLMPLGAALPELPLHLLHLAARDDRDFEARPAELERLVVEAADRSRRGAAYTETRVTFTETFTRRVVYEGNEYRLAAAGEPEDARITVGPSNVGGFVRIAPEVERTPAGPSIAPLAVAGFKLADREWATGIGPVASKP